MVRSTLATAAIAALVGTAGAQHALGDGRGLEKRLELSAPSYRVDRRLAWEQEAEFRDAIVTGNAPNGLYFRGDTAYSNSREFNGQLGSNDLFAFRRDSLYSGLSGQGIRGTESLQFQFALTTGGTAPAGLLGVPATYGSGAGAIGSDFDRRRTAGSELPNWISTDPYGGSGGLMGALRSPSAYLVNRAFQPAVISVSRDLTNASIGMTASGLGGVRSVPLATGQTTQQPASPLLSTPPMAGSVRTSYDVVVEGLAGLAPVAPSVEPGGPSAPAWEERLNELKAQLAELQAGPANPFDRVTESDLRSGSRPEFGDEEPLGYEGLAPETIEMIRRVGKPLERFATITDPNTDFYGEHMRAAQELLLRGAYFDAEERFTRALSVRRDDPAALTGRVHAQIGAGLYRSAAAGLRSLILARPEMAGVRYGSEVLPSTERVGRIMGELRGNLEPDGGASLQRESALLIAYLAFQTGDKETCREALDALEEAGGERVLVDLLQGVWLGKDEQSGG